MKRLLALTAVLTLLLATGTAHAKTWHTWKCRYGIEVTIGVQKENGGSIQTQYTEIKGLRYNPQKHRVTVKNNPATVYLNRRICRLDY